MMNRIRSAFQTEYKKTLIKKDKKRNLSNAAGKLAIIFFVVMIIFTFVSRAASSFTVAKVSVISPRKDRLTHSMTGIGEVTLAEEERIHVIPGYRIGQIYVRAGERAERDTVLFSYSIEDLQDKYNSISKEVEKIKLLMEQEKLRQPIPTENKPSSAALLSLKQAEDNLKIANNKLEEAKEDYDNSITTTKEKLIEGKNKEYEMLTKNYENQLYSQEKQLRQLQRTVDDAAAALERANESKARIDSFIDAYKTAVLSEDRGAIYRAQEEIFEEFYGSAGNYENHKDTIFSTAVAVQGDGYYLWYLKNNILKYDSLVITAYNELQNALSSADPLVNSEQNIRMLKEKYNGSWTSYLSYLEEYERQIEDLESTLEKGGAELKLLRRNDKKLKEYLENFQESIINNLSYEEPREKLYDFILGDKAKGIENDIEAKTLVLTRAREDYKLLEEEFAIQNADSQEELTQLKNTIKSIEDGTYDFMEALEGKRQAVKASEESVRIAKQVVEMNSLQKDTDNNNNLNDQRSKQISELVLQSYKMDLTEKQEELDEVGRLLESQGEVWAPYNCIVSFVGLEEGRMTTGTEIVKIGYEEYVFRAVFDKDNEVKLKTGMKIEVTLSDKKTELDTKINKIIINDNGDMELMAKLVGQSYAIGDRAEFKAASQSEMFNLCIPIQALREDSLGHYVLVTMEQEDILGAELVAERVLVTVTDKSNTTVAVEGALSSRSQVITDSSKAVNNGDRIRIN